MALVVGSGCSWPRRSRAPPCPWSSFISHDLQRGHEALLIDGASDAWGLRTGGPVSARRASVDQRDARCTSPHDECLPGRLQLVGVAGCGDGHDRPVAVDDVQRRRGPQDPSPVAVPQLDSATSAQDQSCRPVGRNGARPRLDVLRPGAWRKCTSAGFNGRRAYRGLPTTGGTASPAALAPLLEVGSLGAERRVVPVAWVHPRLVVQHAEDALVEGVHDRGERIGVPEGVPGPTRECGGKFPPQK